MNPRLLTMTQLDDGEGALDGNVENVAATLVGNTVDYLARLAHVRSTDIKVVLHETFRAPLLGAKLVAERTEHVSAAADALEAILELNFTEHPDGTISFDIDETAVRVVCQLASYDSALRAGPAFYNHESSLVPPDEITTAHILAMVTRAQVFFATHGPITKDGFTFADPAKYFQGDRGGYTDLVDSGDGGFLTADTLWGFKVSKAKPSKDHTLQLLMYFLMGKQSGLPEFEPLTQVGLFNPRLNTVHRLAFADVPANVIDTIRHDVIGYGA